MCADLLRPSESVMDLNIGAALWLAAQAEGRVLVHNARHTCATLINHPVPPASQSPPTTAASNCSQPGHLQQGPENTTASASASVENKGPCGCDPSIRGGEEGGQTQIGDSGGTGGDGEGTGEGTGGYGQGADGDGGGTGEYGQGAGGDGGGTGGYGQGSVGDGGGTSGWYRSRARVVLLGHGADELCAGYGRHRTRFRSHVRLFCLPMHTLVKLR